jgi:hypothetical protein
MKIWASLKSQHFCASLGPHVASRIGDMGGTLAATRSTRSSSASSPTLARLPRQSSVLLAAASPFLCRVREGSAGLAVAFLWLVTRFDRWDLGRDPRQRPQAGGLWRHAPGCAAAIVEVGGDQVASRATVGGGRDPGCCDSGDLCGTAEIGGC